MRYLMKARRIPARRGGFKIIPYVWLNGQMVPFVKRGRVWYWPDELAGKVIGYDKEGDVRAVKAPPLKKART